MNRTVKRFLSPPMIVALIALTLAIGGPAYALSITSKQIKNNTIVSADVKDSSLTGVDIKNKSLTGGDIKPGTVSGTELKDNSVGGIDIANGTVGGADIADGSLGSADIAELSGDRIWNGSILGSSLAAGSIPGSRIAPDGKGARAVTTFAGNCAGFQTARGFGSCARNGTGVYTVLAVSTEAELSQTWPTCSIGGQPTAAPTGIPLLCGATINNTSITIWVADATGAPVEPTGSNPVILVLP